jgi:hypothetical protein
MSTRTLAHQPTQTAWCTTSILGRCGLNSGLTTTSSYIYFITIPNWHSSLMVHPQPFTSDFPRGNIYQMISPDLLHQVIKGTFKDHLVTWICEYLVIQHGERRASVILDDIDRRYVLHIALTTYIEIVADLLAELLQFHPFLVSADFRMVGVSSSGRGTTRRP